MRILTQAFFTSLIIILAMSTVNVAQAASQRAIFAGGCFWCMEADFDKTPGVEKTVSGYIGGQVANPSYEQVSAGGTGHYEAVEVFYNPRQISYQQLLNVFWKNIDPTDAGGQFCDRGKQYRAAIFYLNAQQKKLAEASKQKLLESKRFNQVATQILAAKKFYPAEDYHQNYWQKNPIRYKFYRYRCGRDQRLEKVWGK